MNTKIEWTKGGKTWNPIKARLKADLELVSKSGGLRVIPAGKVGYHCEHISEGCRFCYAESGNCRTLPAWGTGLDYTVPNRELVDIFLDRKVLTEPMTWRKPCFCFPCSMTDLFADFVPDEFIDQVFAVMALTPHITYQVLTKRARRMQEYLQVTQACAVPKGSWADLLPLPNVWLGVSVENQPTADERIPELLRTPAIVRFISDEPCLGDIDWRGFVTSWHGRPALDWGIVGCESGPRARPGRLQTIRSTIRQFRSAKVPLFVKQVGSRPTSDDEADLPYLASMTGKGGNMSEWPEDLRVREFPKSNF